MAKPNVVVFGASKAGENYLKNQDSYHVLAIADNDVNKQGKDLFSISIIPPQHINQYPYDFIVIASMFIEGITKQLLDELSVEKDKIIYVPKRLLKIEDKETFRDPETNKLAHDYLKRLNQFFIENSYTYFLNFGTLLGIVRDGDLIPWDDDIDLAVIKDFEETVFMEKIKNACRIENVDLEFLGKRKLEYGLVGLDITVNSANTFPFTISVDLLIKDGDQYKLPIDTVPVEYFTEQQSLQLGDMTLYGPSPVEKYLTHVYRDWQIVKKDVTYENNTTTYEEPKNLTLQKE